MNAMVERKEQMQDPILLVIARAAENPNVDVDKMERLLQMHERVQQRQAEAAFYADLSTMQAELPSIDETGQIRDRSGKVQSTYAHWSEINDVIKPIMQRHGFALSFRTSQTESNNLMTIYGILSHRGGHRTETSMRLPPDTSGNKNDVQAIGSSISYGCRYCAKSLLNITSRAEIDNDGGARRESAAATAAKGPSSAEKDALMVSLGEAAKDGMESLVKAWQAETDANRKIVGASFADLKKGANAADKAKAEVKPEPAT